MVKVTDDTQGVTCSRLPTLMGVAHPKAQTRTEYWDEIRSKRAGTWIESKQNTWSRRTDRMEEMVIDMVLDDNPHLRILEGANEIPYIADDIPLACSIDAMAVANEPITFVSPANDDLVISGKFVLEVKCTSSRRADLPLYQGPIQVQGQMYCTGIEQALIVRFNTITWEIEYWGLTWHQKTIDNIKTATKDFWDHVITGKPFDAEKDSDYQLLYSMSQPKTIDLTGNNHVGSAVADWVEGKKMREDGLAKMEQASEIIKPEMQDNEFAKVGDKKIHWPTRYYKSQPEKVVPQKAAYQMRQKTISIKDE